MGIIILSLKKMVVVLCFFFIAMAFLFMGGQKLQIQ